MRAIFYIPATGLVTKCIEGTPEIIEANKGPGEEFIEGQVDDPSAYLVVNGEAVPKPSMPIVITGNTITQIPAGTTAISGIFSPVIVEDGTLAISTQHPQKVRVSLINDLFISTTVEVQT